MEIPTLASNEKLLGIEVSIMIGESLNIVLEDKIRLQVLRTFSLLYFTCNSSFVRRTLFENQKKQKGKTIFTPNKFEDLRGVNKEFFISFR